MSEFAKDTNVPDDTISRQVAIEAIWSLDVELRPSAIDTILKRLNGLPSVQPELTDDMAIEHLQSTGWMQNHDKEMYEAGLRERLADDSDSYDSLIPSAQPLVLTCDGCKHIGRYDTDFPCSRCIRREKDYYDREL